MEFIHQLETNRQQAIARLAQAKYDEWSQDGEAEVVRCLAALLARFDDDFLGEFGFGLPAAAEPGLAPPSTLSVWAEAYSDDRNVRLQFDVAAYLEAATEDTIRELARCGWGGDHPADEVALAYNDGPTRPLFDYLELVNGWGRDTQGFECHVSESQARAWLIAYRPELWQKLVQENLT